MNQEHRITIAVGMDNSRSVISIKADGVTASVEVDDEKLYAAPHDPKAILNRVVPMVQEALDALVAKLSAPRVAEQEPSEDAGTAAVEPTGLDARLEAGIPSPFDSVPSAPETKDSADGLLEG